MANYPKNLPRMQRTRAIPVVWLSSGLYPNRPKGWIHIKIIKNGFRGPMKALSKGWILWLLWGGRQIMSTWFSGCKVMTSMLLVCVGVRPVLRYKDLILSASYVWGNKETTEWKSRSVSTPRDGTQGLIHAACHSSVLVSYIFLEIQITEEYSVQLDSYRWRLPQEIPDLRTEQKIPDDCLSILILPCVSSVQ